MKVGMMEIPLINPLPGFIIQDSLSFIVAIVMISIIKFSDAIFPIKYAIPAHFVINPLPLITFCNAII